MAKRELSNTKVEESKIDEIVEESTTPVEEVTEAMPTPVGVVSNCSKLNIRKKPNIKSDIVIVVDAKTQLEINEGKSKDWYKVTVKAGVEGYCMKKYVTLI